MSPKPAAWERGLQGLLQLLVLVSGVEECPACVHAVGCGVLEQPCLLAPSYDPLPHPFLRLALPGWHSVNQHQGKHCLQARFLLISSCQCPPSPPACCCRGWHFVEQYQGKDFPIPVKPELIDAIKDVSESTAQKGVPPACLPACLPQACMRAFLPATCLLPARLLNACSAPHCFGSACLPVCTCVPTLAACLPACPPACLPACAPFPVPACSGRQMCTQLRRPLCGPSWAFL